MPGVYIHIPYCSKACSYCDFHFSTVMKTRESFLEAICQEMELRKEELETLKPETLYFGGGTPSLLTAFEIRRIIDVLGEYISLDSIQEFTLEANPENLESQYLEKLLKIGVNRLSIGIQSYHEHDLELLNRSHNLKQAQNSPMLAREIGFENISLDLMFALPGMTVDLLRSNLQMLLSFAPEHVSIYGLSIEKKTAFANWLRSGKIVEVGESEQAEQYSLLSDTLISAGYEHYEISNFALPGRRSKHNSAYWNGEAYVGLGPSAHSFRGSRRSWNISNTPKYLQSIERGVRAYEEEELGIEEQVNEFLLTRLRLAEGFNLAEFENVFGGRLRKELGAKLKAEAGYFELIEERIRMRQKYRILLDHVLAKLFF